MSKNVGFSNFQIFDIFIFELIDFISLIYEINMHWYLVPTCFLSRLPTMFVLFTVNVYKWGLKIDCPNTYIRICFPHQNNLQFQFFNMAGCNKIGESIHLTQIGLTVEFNHERKRRGRHKYFCPQWRVASIR